MKCSEENVILRGIFHVVSHFPLHVMLYRGNCDYFWTKCPNKGVYFFGNQINRYYSVPLCSIQLYIADVV